MDNNIEVTIKGLTASGEHVFGDVNKELLDKFVKKEIEIYIENNKEDLKKIICES